MLLKQYSLADFAKPKQSCSADLAKGELSSSPNTAEQPRSANFAKQKQSCSADLVKQSFSADLANGE